MASTQLNVGLLVALLCAFLCLPSHNKAEDVILTPLFGSSHYFLFKRIGEELANRGHKVTMLLSSAQSFKPSDKISIKVYQVPYKPGFEEEFIEKSMAKSENDTKNEISGFQKLHSFAELHANFCRSLLDLEGIRDLKPGVIVGDSHFICSGIVAEFFNVKLVLVCPSGLTHAMLPVFKSPNPLSYAPQPFTGLDDNMTFTERLINVAGFLLANIIGRVFMFPAMDKVKQQYNIKPDVSAGESLGKAEVVLVQSHFALDFPRPLTPAIIVTGPLLPRPAKSLPPELKSFMTSSGDDGVIVVSFGSMLSTLPTQTLRILAKVLGGMKQKVLWKIKGSLLSSKPSNIKTVDWMPQNDILGQARTRLFLSHVGHNSMYEAAYHGVPIIGFPMWSDQPENARQITRAGVGLWVDINTVSEDELHTSISRVLSEPSFKQNAIRVSRLIKDQRRTPPGTDSCGSTTRDRRRMLEKVTPGDSKSEDLSSPKMDCVHRNGRKHSEMEVSSLTRFLCMRLVAAEVFISCKCMQHSSLELLTLCKIRCSKLH